MSKHFHSLKVKEIIKETNSTVSIVFDIPSELNSEFNYESGQYLTLRTQIGGEDVRRSYSISSCSGVDSDIQVSSKMIPNGKMSTYLFNSLAVGDSIDVMPPEGGFVLKETTKPLVLFAAGSGITPIFSILKKALKEGNQTVHLYYGNRSDEDVIFNNQLKELRNTYSSRLMVQHFLSSNGERIDAERTADIVNGMNQVKDSAQFFVCGPEGMIKSVKSGLENANVSSNQINIEYFASPSSNKKVIEQVVSGEINEIIAEIDGESHSIELQQGETILEGATRIGIDPPFSCQSGVCTTCKAKLISGEVDMENNFGLGEDEIEDGFVLTCIGTPKTAGVKISWDED